VSQVLELVGGMLAAGALAAAVLTRYRMTSLAEAVARSCHEVRGPLTAARLGLVLASRTGQLADVRLRAIELELERATLALEDLSEAWHGAGVFGRSGVAPGWEQLDVAQLLAESVEAWQAPARAQGVELRLVESPARPTVIGERLRLAQAICNLIANAVEHGRGPVEVSWRIDAATVRIEVVDEGPGLRAPVAELAQRRRVRAGSRRGHGLAVASAVATAHGGRLASAPSERGARLVLELPEAQPAMHRIG
jgi:signal transduction histidine kinase